MAAPGGLMPMPGRFLPDGRGAGLAHAALAALLPFYLAALHAHAHARPARPRPAPQPTVAAVPHRRSDMRASVSMPARTDPGGLGGPASSSTTQRRAAVF